MYRRRRPLADNYPWPQSGEIDIYEGVNSRTFNSMTLHTAAGCTRNLSTPMTGSIDGADSNCNAGKGNTGCGVMDMDPKSYGAGFNAAGGGVFAVLFAETGCVSSLSLSRRERMLAFALFEAERNAPELILLPFPRSISIWRFTRSSIPSDIKSGAPRWKSWGTPVAAWDGATCDTRTYFKNQMLTFVSLRLHPACPCVVIPLTSLTFRDGLHRTSSASRHFLPFSFLPPFSHPSAANLPSVPAISLLTSPRTSRSTCGDWAGQQAVFTSPSLSGACYPKYASCAAANADPDAFKKAYFEVNYVKGVFPIVRLVRRKVWLTKVGLVRSLLGLNGSALPAYSLLTSSFL